MSKKQTKTNNSQQDNRSVKSGLLQPADIHNREQEYDLIEKALMFKPILNPNQMAMFHRYIKQAKLKGIKLGKQIREDEIIKKLDGFCFSLDNKEDILIRNKLKQKIKSEGKND